MTTWIKSITVDCEDALPVAAFSSSSTKGAFFCIKTPSSMTAPDIVGPFVRQ